MKGNRAKFHGARRATLVTLFCVGLIASLVCRGAQAQDRVATGRITGIVVTQDDGQLVPAVQVRLAETDLAVWTGNDGRFTFDVVLAGTYRLVVEDDAFETYETPVNVGDGETFDVTCSLAQRGFQLDDVVVVGVKKTEDMARQQLKREEITAVPGANNDVIRVIETLPGTAYTSVAGFSDGLVIRGTSAEDSQYYLNGFEIPQLFHFGGFVSIINSELVDDIAYYPGAYHVGYGNALGGVIEVTTRRPRTDRIGGVADLSSYSTFGLAEGPAGDKLSWAAGVRRSLIDFILPEVIPKDAADFTLAPRFYDYTAMFDYVPNANNEFDLFFLGSDDGVAVIGEEDPSDPFSGNSFDARIAWQRLDARWRYATQRFSNSLAASFLHSQAWFKFGPDWTLATRSYQPHVREDAQLELGSWNKLRVGADARLLAFEMEATIMRPPKEGERGAESSGADTIQSDLNVSEWLFGAYLDDVMEPARWVQLVPGARVEYVPYLEEVSIDPRLTVNFLPTDAAKIKMAGGVYHQWPEADEVIEDFGNPKLDAEVAYLGSLGFEYDFGYGYFIDVQGYYKALENLVAGTESDSAEPYENTGRGFVYGAELLARKRLTDRLMGWLSYTYSVSRRKDSATADWRYFDQDQRHNFVILASYLLGQQKQWRLGAKWQYSTGLPDNEIDGAIYNADTDTYTPLFSEEVNGIREDDFHKLDVRVDKYWFFNKWTLAVYLDVQNVYWQEQAFGYAYNYDYTEKKAVGFPSFMPSLGVQGRF